MIKLGYYLKNLYFLTKRIMIRNKYMNGIYNIL